MKSANFWSQLGSGFGELGSTPPPGIPRNTPPPPQDFEEVIHNRTAISANLLYLSYVVLGWYFFCGKRTFGWDQGLLAIGLWWEPLNNYLLRYSHGSPASFLILFLNFFFVWVQLIPNLMQTGRYTTCLASNPLNPSGEGWTEQSFVLGSAQRTKPLPLLYPFYNFPLTNGTPFTYLV